MNETKIKCPSCDVDIYQQVKKYESSGDTYFNSEFWSFDLICKECGITIPTFYKWINGETKRIPKNSKEKISELTNISVEELFPE